MTTPHDQRDAGAARTPSRRLDADSRRAIKGARTKRLKRRLAPFDALDAEVVDLIRRLEPESGDIGTNVARAILQAQTLRKELLLGKLKAEEIERRLEESDVRAEFEDLKSVLREHGVLVS